MCLGRFKRLQDAMGDVIKGKQHLEKAGTPQKKKVPLSRARNNQNKIGSLRKGKMALKRKRHLRKVIILGKKQASTGTEKPFLLEGENILGKKVASLKLKKKKII